MASDKFRTSLVEAQAILLKYGVDPQMPSTKVMVRAFQGIDRSYTDTIIATFNGTTKTVVDPKANGETYTGTWRISKVDVDRVDSGQMAGSDTIVQYLGIDLFTYAGAGNEYLARVNSEVYEQPENPWMYYERYIKYETKKWLNMSKDAAITAYDLMYRIQDGNTYIASLDSLSGINAIIRATATASVSNRNFAGGAASLVAGTYYIISGTFIYPNPSYIPGGGGTANGDLIVTAIVAPRIDNCQYELEQDGSFTLYRTLRTYSTEYWMRTREYMKYYGLVLTAGTPVAGNSTIAIDGLANATEVIHANAKFTVGSDTYRVTADATAVAGAVTLSITPVITADTEALGDNAQVYFAAVY
jgi:hypothetical protein